MCPCTYTAILFGNQTSNHRNENRNVGSSECPYGVQLKLFTPTAIFFKTDAYSRKRFLNDGAIYQVWTSMEEQ